MNDFYRVVLTGSPRPLKRPKFVRRGPHSFAVNTQKQEMIFDKIKLSTQVKLIEGPVHMFIVFHMPIAASWSQKKRDFVKEKYCPTKPDLDNLIKYLLDVLTGIAFHGDQQVVSIEAEKVYSDEPRTEAILVSSRLVGGEK